MMTNGKQLVDTNWMLSIPVDGSNWLVTIRWATKRKKGKITNIILKT